MSSIISTRDGLSSSSRHASGRAWRVVEAQHIISTAKLTDNAEEQTLLENLTEDTKPNIPPECRHLNYLLATPFRYGAPYPKGSRFRKAGRTLGVFYAADNVDTAIAEICFRRLLFFCRIRRHRMAGGGRRIHRLCGGIRNAECDRFDPTAVRRPGRALDACDAIRRLPGACGIGPRGRHRSDQIFIGARSAP
jgi:hypothetical protein